MPRFPSFGATSVSQMAVSTASTWQKNGRMSLNPIVAPVLEEPGRLRRHAPVVRILDRPPFVDFLAKLIDGGREVVFLVLGRKVLRGGEVQLGLRRVWLSACAAWGWA